ncbi:MAG: ribonuclease HII [Sphingobacteriales bacterium]|jgi:ribonuclease HII
MAELLNQYQDVLVEAGCDEAGRGCLAGPVVAAAVILNEGVDHPLLNDSKQVSEKNRNELRKFIEKNARAWAVGICSPQEIDEINILKASFLAMHKAVDGLRVKPGFLSIDGNRFTPYKNLEFACIIKGDAKYKNIAAASILAKTHRDEIMKGLAIEHPEYSWEQNMGYPTKKHREAIYEFGITIHHRKTFRQLPEQLSMKI